MVKKDYMYLNSGCRLDDLNLEDLLSVVASGRANSVSNLDSFLPRRAESPEGCLRLRSYSRRLEGSEIT